MFFFFFFNDTATTEIYTLSLTTLFRSILLAEVDAFCDAGQLALLGTPLDRPRDRKSTRLNSSHSSISYAVFCLKKKIEIIRVQFNLTVTDRVDTIRCRLNHQSSIVCIT